MVMVVVVVVMMVMVMVMVMMMMMVVCGMNIVGTVLLHVSEHLLLGWPYPCVCMNASVCVHGWVEMIVCFGNGVTTTQYLSRIPKHRTLDPLCVVITVMDALTRLLPVGVKCARLAGTGCRYVYRVASDQSINVEMIWTRVDPSSVCNVKD